MIKRLSENSLYFFAKFILGYDWLTVKIHLPLCLIIQDYETNKRVKVTLPRSWLKSTVCSISYPIWRSVKNPNVCILLVQNSATNARGKLRSIRGHFESNQMLRGIWPEVLPDKDCLWTSDKLELKRTQRKPEVTFEAAGRASQVVGRHYNVIIEDDTVAPDKDEYTEDNVLPTKDDIGQAIGYHRNTWFLLIDPNLDQILVVGTRWFELDLLSWIDKQEPWYKSYVRAVREDQNGNPDPDGDIVWQEKYGEQALEMAERTVGPYLFSCLYLNTPLRSEDMIFQKQWFHYYDIAPKELEVTITVDPAGNPKNSQAKRKKKNDYNVVMVCGKNRSTNRYYVLEYKRFKGSPGQLLDAIFDAVQRYGKNVKSVGIEAIAYQESLDYFTREEMVRRKVYFDIALIKHGGRSKEFRIRSLQPMVKASAIVFRGIHRELIAELEVFPLGANDDLADALAMQLQLWKVQPLDENESELETNDEANFTLDAAVRSLAAAHRPPKCSVMDVLVRQDGPQGSDPYAYLFEHDDEGLIIKPSNN